ncbi:MAG TPA: hypothetical protein VLC95_14595 [Anaerolineae bacterium]|nr:hypothetical protein [Anaerolineae bacterium]
MNVVGSILVLYSWTLAAVLILGLFFIGRYYQMRYGQKSRYQLFLAPVVLLFAAGVWDAFFANGYTGDPLLDFVGAWGPDLLLLLGGSVLILLAYSLHRKMMGGRR